MVAIMTRVWRHELASTVAFATKDVQASMMLTLGKYGELHRGLTRMSQEIRIAMLQDNERFSLVASLLTDDQMFELEARDDLVSAVVCKRQMGTEFEDPEDRDSVLPYAAVVKSNLAKSPAVHYCWIAESSEESRTRAQTLTYILGEWRTEYSVHLVTRQQWRALPFEFETVFYQLRGGFVEAFMLVPFHDEPSQRLWMKLPPAQRDSWFDRTRQVRDQNTPYLSHQSDA